MSVDSKVGVVAVADSREGTAGSTASANRPDELSLDSVVKLSAAGTSQPTQPTDPESIDPRIRTRLDEIRVAIKHDRYPIDLDKLASKMVDDEVVRSSDVS